MARHGSRPLPGNIRLSFNLHGSQQSEIADIADHASGTPDGVNGGLPHPGHARNLFEDAFLLTDIKGSERCCAGKQSVLVFRSMAVSRAINCPSRYGI
jgi:hypothetical protein